MPVGGPRGSGRPAKKQRTGSPVRRTPRTAKTWEQKQAAEEEQKTRAQDLYNNINGSVVSRKEIDENKYIFAIHTFQNYRACHRRMKNLAEIVASRNPEATKKEKCEFLFKLCQERGTRFFKVKQYNDPNNQYNDPNNTKRYKLEPDRISKEDTTRIGWLLGSYF